MKNQFFAVAAIATLAFTACNNEKPYTISGSVDIPMTLEMGDSVVDRPSLEGMSVYLYDFDEQVVDSTVFDADEHFSFEGTVNAKNPHFLFLVTPFASNMIAIEPGDISVVIGEEMTITGTPNNDGITDFTAALYNLQQDSYMQFAALQDSLGENLSTEVMMEIYQKTQAAGLALVDSFYNANKNNLVGVYAIHFKTAGVQTSAELKEALDTCSEFVSTNELFQKRIEYYDAMEGMPAEGFDPSIFDMADEGEEETNSETLVIP